MRIHWGVWAFSAGLLLAAAAHAESSLPEVEQALEARSLETPALNQADAVGMADATIVAAGEVAGSEPPAAEADAAQTAAAPAPEPAIEPAEAVALVMEPQAETADAALAEGPSPQPESSADAHRTEVSAGDGLDGSTSVAGNDAEKVSAQDEAGAPAMSAEPLATGSIMPSETSPDANSPASEDLGQDAPFPLP